MPQLRSSSVVRAELGGRGERESGKHGLGLVEAGVECLPGSFLKFDEQRRRVVMANEFSSSVASGSR